MANKKRRQGYFSITPDSTIYSVSFEPSFNYPPRSVRADLHLVNETGEIISAAVLRNSITQNGAIFILSANPTELSVGSRFHWQAKL